MLGYNEEQQIWYLHSRSCNLAGETDTVITQMGVITNCINVSNFQKTKKEKTENRYLETDFNLKRKRRLPMETEGTGRRVGSKSEQTIPGSWWRNEFQGPSTNQCQTLLRGWGNEDLRKGHRPVQ